MTRDASRRAEAPAMAMRPLDGVKAEGRLDDVAHLADLSAP